MIGLPAFSGSSCSFHTGPVVRQVAQQSHAHVRRSGNYRHELRNCKHIELRLAVAPRSSPHQLRGPAGGLVTEVPLAFSSSRRTTSTARMNRWLRSIEISHTSPANNHSTHNHSLSLTHARAPGPSLSPFHGRLEDRERRESLGGRHLPHRHEPEAGRSLPPRPLRPQHFVTRTDVA